MPTHCNLNAKYHIKYYISTNESPLHQYFLYTDIYIAAV